MAQRVLIIEDEAGIADPLRYALSREGFDVEWAGTAADASTRLSEEDFSLLILDVGLPDQNGLDWLKDLRKTSTIPVIVLTARSDEVDRIVGLEIGADDYVTKPFSPREVAVRAKTVLRRSTGRGAPANGNAGEADGVGFRVDVEKSVIYFQGRSLVLSRTEYGILALLLKRPGTVFSREKIMDQVWHEPEESFDRAVDTHIKNIRARIREIDPAADPIETRRGMGYAIKEPR